MSKPLDPRTLNMIDPDKPKSIFDPNSEFRRELELYKLKSEVNYRVKRPNLMRAQTGMFADVCKEIEKPKIFIPSGKGGFV